MSEPSEPSATSSVRVASTSHRVTVLAQDRPDVAFDGRGAMTHDGEFTTIDSVASALTVYVPRGTTLLVGSDSGRVDIAGEMGDVAVVTESGRITIDRAASVDARTSTARVVVRGPAGRCRVRSESGRVEIDACQGANVSTNSGRIAIKGVDGPVEAHCVSGRIEIEMDAAYDVNAETVTGRVDVTFPPGVEVFESVEPTGISATPAGCDCTVNARSVTGRVAVSSR